MVLSYEILTVDPRVILHKELGTVFALAKENFATTWMNFSIFSDVIDASLVYCPTIIFFVMFLDFFHCISDFVRIFN